MPVEDVVLFFHATSMGGLTGFFSRLRGARILNTTWSTSKRTGPVIVMALGRGIAENIKRSGAKARV